MQSGQGFPPELLHYLGQTGRFDLVSMLLAAIGLILVIGGLFAFLNLRSVAKQVAKEEATKISIEIAERVANEYLQRELPGLLDEYRGFMAGRQSDEDADRMAQAQVNDDSVG